MPQRALRTPSDPRGAHRGFTLVEMLVVMAIIVLAVTMAVPAIKFLTGSRSQESANNTLSAFLGFARNEAVAQQQTTGVLFILDDDDRVKCYEVQASTDAQSGLDAAGVTYLDLVPDRDPLSLPTGVRLWTLNDLDQTAPKFNGYRYLGMNPVGDFSGDNASIFRPGVRIGGVILFGADGRLQMRPFGFRFATHNTAGATIPTALMQIFTQDQTTTPSSSVWPTSASVQVLNSSIGCAMCDKNEQYTNIGDGGEGNDDAKPSTINNYLDANTTPLFVNRYSGTLMQAE